MYRATSGLNKTVKNVADTVRFMPKAKRRAFYYGFAGLTSLTTTGVYLGAQTFLLENVVVQLRSYKNNLPVKANSEVTELFQQTLGDVDKNLQNSDRISLFNFVGSDLYSLGNARLPSGAQIGIPFYMNFNDARQFKPEDIRLLGQYKTKRSSSSPVMKKLFDAFILSDDAKRYALAHQMHLVSSPALFVKSLNIFLCTATSFVVSQSINSRIFSTQKKLPRVFSSCLCFLIITVFGGAMIDQMLDEIYDLKAMKQTLAMGAQYRRGAIEFYTKIIQKNASTFELLADQGSKYFTEDGKVKKMFGLYTESYENHLILAKNFSS